MEKNFRKIEIDTERHSLKCDGAPLQNVTHVLFDWDANKRYPEIRISQDSEVLLSGILATGQIKKMKCGCGYYVGEFIAPCSAVICPSCGKTING